MGKEDDMSTWFCGQGTQSTMLLGYPRTYCLKRPIKLWNIGVCNLPNDTHTAHILCNFFLLLSTLFY